MRGYVCAGGGVADYEDLFIGIRGRAAVVFGVSYEAGVGFVPGFHAGHGGDGGDCIVPVCHYHSVVGVCRDVAGSQIFGFDNPGILAFLVLKAYIGYLRLEMDKMLNILCIFFKVG